MPLLFDSPRTTSSRMIACSIIEASDLEAPPIVSGWTVFTASGDTRTVYVSGTGSDANDGLSTGAPKLTIAAGLALIRNGYPDWLLLKKGDTWTNQEFGYISVSGRSIAEPILFSSYGTGARPVIKTSPSGSGAAIGAFEDPISHVCFVGLDFHAYTRNPDDGGFVGAGVEQNGMRILNTATNLLIEDCIFRFYGGNTVEGVSSNIRFRRSQIVDCYASGTDHSVGLYIDNQTNLSFDECLFDHNGWNEDVSGADPTIYNQNLYIQYNGGPASVTNCISARASATGIQLRPGGTMTGNLLLRNPVGFQVGSSPGTIPTPIPPNTATVTGNVVLESTDIPGPEGGPRGWGFVLYANTGLVTFQNNIIAHVDSVDGGNIQSIFIDAGADNDVITNNIIYDWGAVDIIDDGTGNTITPNDFEEDSATYVDPERSVATYMTSISGTATVDAFLIACRAQSKEAGWNTNYTAAAVIAYIEAGFEAAPVGVTQVGSYVTIGSTDSGLIHAHTLTSSLTVPSGTELVLVAVISYDANTTFFSSGSVTLTKGGTDTAMTVVPGGGDVDNHVSSCMWYMVNPDIGSSKSLKCLWSDSTSAATSEQLWSITFWQGVDTSSPIRDGDGAQSSGSAVAVSTPTLTASSGDLIVAYAGGYNSGGGGTATFDTWSNLTELDEVGFVLNFEAAWATNLPSGNVAVGLSTATNIGYCAIKAVVLKPAP